MEEFIFNDLTPEDIQSYESDAYVFNVSPEDFNNERVVLMGFEDDRLGKSVEHVDIAVKEGKDSEWVLLDIQDRVDDSGDIVDTSKYCQALIILRRMSSLLIDKEKYNSSCHIISKLSGDFTNSSLSASDCGILASNQVYLDNSFDDVLQGVRSRFSGELLDELVRVITNLKDGEAR